MGYKNSISVYPCNSLHVRAVACDRLLPANAARIVQRRRSYSDSAPAMSGSSFRCWCILV